MKFDYMDDCLTHNCNITDKNVVNAFMANVPMLYPLKTPENQRFLS